LLLSFDSINALPPDPSLLYCSYFGGSGADDVSASIQDEEGNIYICGTTQSLDLPTTPGAHQENFAAGPGLFDGFVAKLSNTYELEWCTYYGGSKDDQIISICYSDGKAYITGQTGSFSGIATIGALDNTLGGTLDCFVACFDDFGGLVWSTYFGGSDSDAGFSITVTDANTLVMTGNTNSGDSIATDNAHQVQMNGDSDAFLAAFSMDGSLIWSTYFGGNQGESGWFIDIDSMGNYYVLGSTTSTEELTFGNVLQSELHGSNDVFIAKFSSSGILSWSTYYGGNSFESARGIGVTNSSLVILGRTMSDSGITLGPDAYQPTYSGGTNDGFLLELSLEGDFLYSTYLGGTGQDEFWDIDVLDNSYYLTAQTSSPEQVTADAFQQDVQGTYDALIMLFGLDHELLYSTYFGAGGSEKGIGISTQNNKTVLIGESSSIEGFTTANAEEPDYLGLGDIYLAAFDNLVGLSEKNAPLIQIFPNPFSDALMIQSDDLIKGISVFDATGRLVLQNEVFSRNAFRFDVHFLNDGIYSVLVRTEKEFFCEEILIVR
jgi:hypothetical protein